jgi:hypothetical protein
MLSSGRTIAQAASRWLSTAAARGRFSPSASVSPANLHSTNCSTITLTYHLGRLCKGDARFTEGVHTNGNPVTGLGTSKEDGMDMPP